MRLKSNIKYIVTGIFALLSLMACNEDLDWQEEYDGNPTGNPVIKVLDDEGNEVVTAPIEHEGGILKLVIESNADWLAKSDQTWVTVNPPSAYGDERLTIRVTPLLNVRSRKATITISASESMKRSFTLLQTGVSLLSREEIEMSYAKSIEPVVINAADEDEWTAEIVEGSSWINISSGNGTGTSTLYVSAETNTSGVVNEARVEIKTGKNDETGEYEIVNYLDLTQQTAMGTLEDRLITGDTLRLEWNKVSGATHYTIKAFNNSDMSLIKEFEAQGTDTAYIFTPVTENIIENFTGIMKVTIEAETLDPAITVSGTGNNVAHSRFDDASGDGTSAATPFIVSNPRHLHNIRYNLGGYFFQSEDIDITGWDSDDNEENGNFTPINLFSGSYDGNGKAIEGLKIFQTSPLNEVIGLFSLVGNGVAGTEIEFKNMIIRNPQVSRISTEAGGCGAIAGKFGNYNIISDCVVEGGEIRNLGARVGAIGGDSGGNTIFTNCANLSCSVFGTQNVGGIIGQGEGYPLLIERCYNTGTITGSIQWIAGIAGTINGAAAGTQTIRYCYNLGDIVGPSTIGGIYGRGMGNKPIITGCWNKGTINATKEIAGGIGGNIQTQNVLIENCYNYGTITTPRKAGGLVGQFTSQNISPNQIVNCYNTGMVMQGAGIGTIGDMSNTGVIGKPGLATVISGTYYLVGTAATGTFEWITSIVESKTEEQMKDLSTYNGWSATEWENGNETYPYPQLINNPHK